ncbi:ABC transporter ATP-binding protein [Pseudogracilibacillus sp. SO30301A]|uniref:ABC transporter ATP-binding protein n=1 Tax=Pseudogracilibacillus sp. SO30301A TaxID=3098291 RepID=UPI00300E1212
MMKLSNISKIYKSGKLEVPVLHDINLEIADGEFIAIMGPSGSGKSTLMNIIGFLDSPTSGDYELNGEKITAFHENQLARLRNKHIGFVFQQFFLLPRLNAIKNVEAPLVYADIKKRERIIRAEEMLAKVGLADRTRHLPNELSGGQKQRVCIARALVNDPEVILADEPTGALDSKTGLQIMELFTQLNEEGKTVIVVTHEEEIAAYANRTIFLRDGVITEERRLDV